MTGSPPRRHCTAPPFLPRRSPLHHRVYIDRRCLAQIHYSRDGCLRIRIFHRACSYIIRWYEPSALPFYRSTTASLVYPQRESFSPLRTILVPTTSASLACRSPGHTAAVERHCPPERRTRTSQSRERGAGDDERSQGGAFQACVAFPGRGGAGPPPDASRRGQCHRRSRRGELGLLLVTLGVGRSVAGRC